MRYRLAAIAALVALLWLPYSASPPPVRAATVCTSWNNTRIPPTTVRVLRTSGPYDGHVQTVDFQLYVKTVIAAEWPNTYPTEALRAGAVAVKQYAWYYIMHYRGGTRGGSCYDVQDNTNDQIFRPETRTPAASHIAAVTATWGTSVTKNGAFLLTGYRSGAWVGCGVDTDGYHMFQHSAYACAKGGKSYREILHISYDPSLVVWESPDPPAALFLSPPAAEQVMIGNSVTASWLEMPTSEGSITSRQITLEMSKPINWSCRSDRWIPAIPPWQSTEASPQTVTGLRDWYCYRFVLKLTEGTTSTFQQSGAFIVDSIAPVATFNTPPQDAVTPLTAGSYTVAWTETPTPGTTIVSRKLTTEYGGEPVAGTCVGARWSSFKSTTAGSPVRVTGLLPLHCFRFRVDLFDSAGHGANWMSGVLMAPATLTP